MVGAERVDDDQNDVAPLRAGGRPIRTPRGVLHGIAARGGEAVDGVAVDVAGGEQRIQREAQRLVFRGRRPDQETIELQPARRRAGDDNQGDERRANGACRERRPVKAAEIEPRRRCEQRERAGEHRGGGRQRNAERLCELR